MKTLIVLSVLFMVSSAKILSRCEVARLVQDSILTAFFEYTVADWVCMAYHESAYNTRALHYERDSEGSAWSADYGIFQINSKWWCVDSMFPGGANVCRINCEDLLTYGSDIQSDIECAAIIVKQQGLEAWVSWSRYCKGRSISHYTDNCS
ncbi:lysozyme C-2-like [Mustelus asterias]